MSRYNELDSYFDKLKQIERPEDNKQKTLVNVLQAKKREHRRQRSLAGGVIILSALIAIFLLITNIDNKEELSAKSIEVEVSEVFVANSVSSTSFKAYSTSPLTTAQVKDEIFNQNIETFLRQLTPLEVEPTYHELAFDMTIKPAEGGPLHMKLWENDGKIILYNLTDEKYYTSSHQSARNVYRMLSNISFPKD